MKLFLLSISILFNSSILWGQCNVHTNHRSDGTTIRYLNPVQIGTGTKCEVGISIQTNGKDFFINTVVRYFSTPQKTIGTLKIQMSNGQSLDLKLYTSELATMNSENISLSVFYLSDDDISKLSKFLIKTIVFTEITGVNQIIRSTTNSNAAMRQINCLLNN